MRARKMSWVVWGALVAGMGCTIVEPGGTGSSSEGLGAQGQPDTQAASAPSTQVLEHERSPTVPEHAGRADVIPIGNPIAPLNQLTGLRDDPRGSEEGLVPVALVGMIATPPKPAPTSAVPFEPTAPFMWGADGPGGPTGGTALPSEAPRTAPHQPVVAEES